MIRLVCLGGCRRPPLEIAEKFRAPIMALIGERHEDPDRFDGVRISGWVVAFIHEFPPAGTLAAVCPDCRPRMLPTYAADGPEFPAVMHSGGAH